MTLWDVPGRFVRDARGPGRVLRVAAHPASGLVVVSTWRDGRCVGTVRLQPDEAAALVAGLSEALARLAVAGVPREALDAAG